MAIDFGAFPPEINSARLYTGAGSTPLVTAASAWNALAAELNQTALGYDNVVTQLASEDWIGPASASMAAAVQPYVEWLNATAAQAEQAATQASAAAAAYESAFTSIVPPPLIAANRAELAQALQTNVFGQNTGTIAALESQYGEMWAQDAATMYSYAGSSASASTVTPFTAAPQIANPAASSTQAAAVTGTSAASIQQTLNSLVSQITKQLQTLAAPLYAPLQSEWNYLSAGNGPLSWLWSVLFGTSAFPSSSLSAFMSAWSPYAGVFYNTEGLPYFSIGMANFLTQTAKTTGALGAAAPAAAAHIPTALPSLGGALGGGAHVSAALGNAGSVGRLSVPAVWNGTLPGTHPGGAPIPVSNVREAPELGTGNLLGGMPLAGAGTGGSSGAGPRYGFRPTVMARPPAAG